MALDEQGNDIEEGGEGAGTPPEEKTEEQIAAEKTAADKAAVEAAEAAEAAKPKYTDADMKKARESFQHETRKERDARIAAETEARVLREMAVKQGTGTPPDKTAAETVLTRPKRDDFDDPDKWDEAMDAYQEAKTKAAVAEALKSVQQQTTVKTEEQKRAEVLNRHLEEGEKESPGFRERITARPEDGGPAFTDAMVAAMMEMENGHSVANALEQNRDELGRIRKLSPVRQAVEIGILSATLKKASSGTETTTSTTTKAPPPAATVAASRSTSKRSILDATTQAERDAIRQQELEASWGRKA